jgi:hypothetical protein
MAYHLQARGLFGRNIRLEAKYETQRDRSQRNIKFREERERKRSDRRKGLAHSQFDIVHASKPSDLVIDTSILTPEDCATKILNARPDRLIFNVDC